MYRLDAADLPSGTQLEDVRLALGVGAVSEPQPDIERSMVGLRNSPIEVPSAPHPWPYADVGEAGDGPG